MDLGTFSYIRRAGSVSCLYHASTQPGGRDSQFIALGSILNLGFVVVGIVPLLQEEVLVEIVQFKLIGLSYVKC